MNLNSTLKIWNNLKQSEMEHENVFLIKSMQLYSVLDQPSANNIFKQFKVW